MVKNIVWIFIFLAAGFCFFSTSAKEESLARELIHDGQFLRGFFLVEPSPGRHVRRGELRGFESDAKPAWALLEWSSRFPLDAARLDTSQKDILVCSNSAKSIVLGRVNTARANLSLGANSAVEYGPDARTAAEPWVHLLVEQSFDPPAAIEKMRTARLHLEARLLRSRNLHQGDYKADVHAAQFQIFFTVQNYNKQSKGFGDMLWFGVPIYDNRDRLPKEYKSQDFGGTGKFIFTPDAKTFCSETAHDGKWIVIEKDLLPLMRESLETAWERGFLRDSQKHSDYFITGMNMGWELPGTFDVEMQVKNLSLQVMEK